MYEEIRCETKTVLRLYKNVHEKIVVIISSHVVYATCNASLGKKCVYLQISCDWLK